MMKMQLERDRCCILLSRGTCTISVNIIVHCKRVQEYAKNIFKNEKYLLKPETIQEPSKTIRILSHKHIKYSEGRVIVNFWITFGLISIAE